MNWIEDWEVEVSGRVDLNASDRNKLIFSVKLLFDLKSMIIGFEQICNISFQLNPGCIIKSVFVNSDLVENIFCQIREAMGKITTLPTVNMDRPSTAFFWDRHALLPSLSLVKLQAFHFLSQKGSSIETELRLRHIIFGNSFGRKFVYSTIILSSSRLTVSGIYRKSRHATNWVCRRKLVSSSPACFLIVLNDREVGAVRSESSKVYIRANRLISPELILVLVA